MRGVAFACRFLGLGLALCASSADAADSVKRECAQSATQGQRLRDDGKPLAARAQFLACARAACPVVIRSHCGRWLEEAGAAVPTVVVRARAGATGHRVDVTDVEVDADGAIAAPSLDGKPLPLEPGEHTLRYVRAGSPAVEERVLLVAGEKNRYLTVEFPPDGATKPSAGMSDAAAAPANNAPAAPGSAAIRPAAWVFAALTVVAGVSFAYFGLSGKSDLDNLRATCAGHCASSDVYSAWDKLIVADASLGVGVVSAAVATWFFLSPRHGESPPKSSDVGGLFVAPSARGVETGWRGSF